MNIKALLATASIAATSLITAPAQAASSYCYTVGNGASTVCILSVIKHNNWPYNRTKLVKTSINGRVKSQIVECPYAHQYNYKENMAGIACYEFN